MLISLNNSDVDFGWLERLEGCPPQPHHISYDHQRYGNLAISMDVNIRYVGTRHRRLFAVNIRDTVRDTGTLYFP